MLTDIGRSGQIALILRTSPMSCISTASAPCSTADRAQSQLAADANNVMEAATSIDVSGGSTGVTSQLPGQPGREGTWMRRGKDATQSCCMPRRARQRPERPVSGARKLTPARGVTTVTAAAAVS